MVNEDRLKQVYRTMLTREWIVQGSRKGITGPIPPEDGIITEEYIGKLRAGCEEATHVYRGGLEQNIAIPSSCWPLIENDFEVLKQNAQLPGYNPRHFFEMGADMLLLAQAGILRRDNYSESTDLFYWKLNEKNEDLIPRDKDQYQALFTEALNQVGSCDKDSKLAELEKRILGSLQ